MLAVDAAPVNERNLGLRGASNFRDLGGYLTESGSTVRWRRLFRSNHLGDLTAADQAMLAGIGLRRICDLRSEAEHRASPPAFAGAALHSLPIDPSVTREIRELVAAGAAIHPEMVTGLMEETYRAFVRDHVDAYRALFGHLLESDEPLVFHCSAGKDRTGFAAAVILAALGVPRATIVDDYLLTNSLWQIDPATHRHLPAPALTVLASAEESFLAAAFEAIDADFGGVGPYLRDSLGVGPAERQRLAELYLSP